MTGRVIAPTATSAIPTPAATIDERRTFMWVLRYWMGAGAPSGFLDEFGDLSDRRPRLWSDVLENRKGMLLPLPDHQAVGDAYCGMTLRYQLVVHE
jgi:hypothetical protein